MSNSPLQAEIERFRRIFPNAKLTGHDRDAEGRKKYRVVPVLRVFNNVGEKFTWAGQYLHLLDFSEEGLGGSYKAVNWHVRDADGRYSAYGSCVRYGPGCDTGTVREELGGLFHRMRWFLGHSELIAYCRSRGWDAQKGHAMGEAFRTGDQGLKKWLLQFNQPTAARLSRVAVPLLPPPPSVPGF